MYRPRTMGSRRALVLVVSLAVGLAIASSEPGRSARGHSHEDDVDRGRAARRRLPADAATADEAQRAVDCCRGELGDALASVALTTSRAVVIAGEGRAFSAGADVTEFRDATPGSILAYYRDTGDVYERFAALPQPTSPRSTAGASAAVSSSLSPPTSAIADASARLQPSGGVDRDRPELRRNTPPRAAARHGSRQGARAPSRPRRRAGGASARARDRGRCRGRRRERALELAPCSREAAVSRRLAREAGDRRDGRFIARSRTPDRAHRVRRPGADA